MPSDLTNIAAVVNKVARALRRRREEPTSGSRTIKKLRSDLGDVSDAWPSTWNVEDSFIPAGEIAKLDVAAIRELLRPSKNHNDNMLIDWIQKSAMRLLVLTVLFSQDEKKVGPYMLFFRKNGYEDSEWMTRTNFQGSIVPSNKISYFDKNKLCGAGNSDLFDVIKAGDFVKKQWEVLVPIFYTDVDCYYFHPSTVLPIQKVKNDNQDEMRGAFSIVFQVRIHPDHFKDPLRKDEHKTPEFFAVKQLIPPPTEAANIGESWRREIQALQRMNKSRAGDHIIRCITGFVQRDTYHLILEWADGGTLEDLYEKFEYRKLDGKLVKHVVHQLKGLATALYTAHELPLSGPENNGTDNMRHGDLKPAKILRFGPFESNNIGHLKIGDWGLAKLHTMATSKRVVNNIHTDNKYGTSRYEPPEANGRDIILSRRYDTWSMGVVILELLIWLLHGREGLNLFRDGVKKAKAIRETCWKGTPKQNNTIVIEIEDSVKDWLTFLKDDPICGDRSASALGAVLHVVETRLLVISIDSEDQPAPQGPPAFDPASADQQGGPTPVMMLTRPTVLETSNGTTSRATAKEFSELLEDIMAPEEDVEDYWYRDRLRPALPDKIKARARTSHLQPGAIPSVTSVSSHRGIEQSIRGNTVQMPRAENLSVHQQQFLDNEWTLHKDEDFALETMSKLKILKTSEQLAESAKLCSLCSELDIFRPTGFSIEYSITELTDRSRQCPLCALFLKSIPQNLKATLMRVRFDRKESHLVINNTPIRVVSIVQGSDFTLHPDVSLGIPNIPHVDRDKHFEIIRQWLRLCDDKKRHQRCQGPGITPSRMPKRLIDVRQNGDTGVNIWEPGVDAVCEYVALSHPWGSQLPFFVSTQENIDDHRRNIDISDLPATFQDAIETTRAIGKRYLWIDSLCIIQGLGGDFHSEAGRMESVFSSAYCVLAASRAYHQRDGFLGPRRARDYVPMNMKTGHELSRYYLCENIDAFDKHVLQGHLHKRGWVLQEHALARRTIFFTEHQTYFDNLAAFLGDPEFPRIIMSASQGEKIIRFQNLYKTYSQLEFSNAVDRAIAVNGIQNRLLEAFGTRGGYGVFDEDVQTGQLGLLRRALLWYRPKQTELTRIDFPDSMPVPSWSWMAYMGGIDFLHLEFGQADWVKFQSPWGGNATATTRFTDGTRNLSLWGRAQSISDLYAADTLYFDDSTRTRRTNTRCMVLGIDKRGGVTSERVHYVILVEPMVSLQQLGVDGYYERVGAGFLAGKYIIGGGSWISVF
ncbi:hypothetical protein F5Y18DRAFT_428528 [Xylariaceae sp. FL1019]|nr:hypothetical protein F5Y18DRAFT_428528 [Xylariaceae sp. FL1019]